MARGPGRGGQLAPVELRIEGVEILAVQVILDDSEAFPESLVMGDFALAQEPDRIDDVRIVGQTEDVVVGQTRFLLRRHILLDVSQGVAADGEGRCRERYAGSELRIDAGRVVDEIILHAGRFDLLGRHPSGQLMDDGADHFQMRQLFCTYIGEDAGHLTVRHRIALREIAQRSTQLAVRTSTCQVRMIG